MQLRASYLVTISFPEPLMSKRKRSPATAAATPPPGAAQKFRLRFLSHAAAWFAGLSMALLGNVAWDAYNRPKLSLQYAEGMWEWTQAREGSQIVNVSTLRDRNSDAPVTVGRLWTGDTIITPNSSALVLQLVIQNNGRLAASDLRLPISVMGFGKPSIRWTPNLDLEVDSLERGSHRRIDVLKIRSLPPQATGVITYHFDLDSAFTFNQPSQYAISGPSIMSVSYDNGHAVEIASRPAPLGLVSGLESMINPRGTGYGMMKYWQTGEGAGEIMRTSLRILDPWLRNMDSVAASHGLQSVGDVTAFIRTRYGQ
jgi:hypothetical protein